MISYSNKLKFKVTTKLTAKMITYIFLQSILIKYLKKWRSNGFFLRALRISSSSFLFDEFKRIKNFFSQLQLPEFFIHCTKTKAIKVHKHISYNKNNQLNSNINSLKRAVTSILLYGCTTWTLTKRLEKKLDGNYARMLRAILNKSWRQHSRRH